MRSSTSRARRWCGHATPSATTSARSWPSALPAGSTLWTAAVGERPLRPGTAPDGALLLPLEKGRAGGDTPVFVVELTYVQRVPAWTDKGHATLALPAVDLPIARTGVRLHHSPRFRVAPEPGAFRVEGDVPPFHETLNTSVAPRPVSASESKSVDGLVAQFQKDAAGRRSRDRCRSGCRSRPSAPASS